LSCCVPHLVVMPRLAKPGLNHAAPARIAMIPMPASVMPIVASAMVVAPSVTRNVSNAWHVAMEAHGAPIAIAMPTVNLVERLVIDHGMFVQAANAAPRMCGRTRSSNDGKRADNHNCQLTH
jgi:hypothetical protein